MKIAFLIESAEISGGANVIFQHSIFLVHKHNEVYFLSRRNLSPENYSWHRIFAEYDKLGIKWLTYNQASLIEFDIAIATYYETYYELHQVSAKRYTYFVQSIESRFYCNNNTHSQLFVEATYDLPIGVVTEAKWIKDYLIRLYNRSVYLAPNGIDKSIFKLEGESVAKIDNNKLRVLVEGPIDSIFKNVQKTVQLCGLSEADEIWLLTSTNCSFYPGVSKVFSQVPLADTAKIYRSCDVIVKLSYVEGMFGPPLEAFHCGATAIVYDVTGHDEYIIHGYNGLVAKIDDENQVVKYLNQLKNNSALLKTLKDNAVKSANEWINWEESSINFNNALLQAATSSKVTKEQLKMHSLRCNSFLNLVSQLILKGYYSASHLSQTNLSYTIPNIHWAHRVTKLKIKLLKYPWLYKLLAKIMLIVRKIALRLI
jgi:glycosyltransferase involved in cell wall biosynthesis